jgi:hypothetical protein
MLGTAAGEVTTGMVGAGAAAAAAVVDLSTVLVDIVGVWALNWLGDAVLAWGVGLGLGKLVSWLPLGFYHGSLDQGRHCFQFFRTGASKSVPAKRGRPYRDLSPPAVWISSFVYFLILFF